MGKHRKLEGAPFVIKTFELVNDDATSSIISWSESGDSFVIWKPVEFASDILPKYFKHNNFCSFIRQLNIYGFYKVESPNWEFKHDLFSKNTEDFTQISRRSPKRKKGEKTELTPDTPYSFENIKSEDEYVPKSMVEEMVRMSFQLEIAQTTINRVLEELVESRKAQQTLERKIDVIQRELEFKSLLLAQNSLPETAFPSFSTDNFSTL